MEKSKNRQYGRKNKRSRIAKCIAVMLFAAVLTGIAAYGADPALGSGSSSTGKDRKIPITYTIPGKNVTGLSGEFNSDCQGFYFYVTPVDAQQAKLSYFEGSQETILKGSLAETGETYIGDDKKEHQYTYRYYFENDDEDIKYRWVNYQR